MKVINDIIEWLVQTGLLSVLAIFLLKQLKPVLDNKAEHASTEQSKALWTLLEQVSMTVVNSLVGKDMTGQAKFAEAVTQVQAYLENKGLNVDMKQVQSAVQSAYELSTLTPSVDPNEDKSYNTKKHDPVLEAIKAAPNRANKLTLDKTAEAKG